MPAPMIQTSVRMLSFSRDCDGVSAVSIQMDVLACESSFIGLRRVLRNRFLLRWRSDVHIDTLVTGKPSSTKHKQRAHHKDHEDYENCYDSGARCTATIVCHLFFLLMIDAAATALKPRLFRLRVTLKLPP